MNSKDGIVIKPGQLWRAKDKNLTYRVVCIDGQCVIARLGVTNPIAAVIEYHLHTLERSHDGADLEQARKEGWLIWVDGMDLPNQEDIKVCYRWEQGCWSLVEDLAVGGWADKARKYKLKPTCSECGKHFAHVELTDDGERLFCNDCLNAVEAGNPELKLFEIDWKSAMYPCISNKRKNVLSCGVGLFPIVEGYRIFGYTDDETFADLPYILDDKGNSVKPYETEPCDIAGNRKYAIGRLER